jgi:hypothetical protein
VTTHEAGTMFSLAVYAIISAGLLLWLLARWARDRWVAAGDKAEALADLSRPATVDEHAARTSAAMCPLCRPWGAGDCTCPRDCKHGDCRFGDRATMALFTPEDLREFPGLAPRRRGRRGKRKAGTR